MALKKLLTAAGDGASAQAIMKTGAAHFRVRGVVSGHTIDFVDVSSAEEEVLQSFTSLGSANINLFPDAVIEARVTGGSGNTVNVEWQHRLQAGLMPQD